MPALTGEQIRRRFRRCVAPHLDLASLAGELLEPDKKLASAPAVPIGRRQRPEPVLDLRPRLIERGHSVDAHRPRAHPNLRVPALGPGPADDFKILELSRRVPHLTQLTIAQIDTGGETFVTGVRARDFDRVDLLAVLVAGDKPHLASALDDAAAQCFSEQRHRDLPAPPNAVSTPSRICDCTRSATSIGSPAPLTLIVISTRISRSSPPDSSGVVVDSVRLTVESASTCSASLSTSATESTSRSAAGAVSSRSDSRYSSGRVTRPEVSTMSGAENGLPAPTSPASSLPYSARASPRI